MSKMSKVIAMILIIAAVVFVAGCANKEAPAPANNTTTVNTEETNKSVVISEGNNTSAGMPAETPAVVINTTETNTTVNTTENITTNNTSAPAVNATENITK
jgi:inhibitor of cysteine peptidase